MAATIYGKLRYFNVFVFYFRFLTFIDALQTRIQRTRTAITELKLKKKNNFCVQ